MRKAKYNYFAILSFIFCLLPALPIIYAIIWELVKYHEFVLESLFYVIFDLWFILLLFFIISIIFAIISIIQIQKRKQKGLIFSKIAILISIIGIIAVFYSSSRVLDILAAT